MVATYKQFGGNGPSLTLQHVKKETEEGKVVVFYITYDHNEPHCPVPLQIKLSTMFDLLHNHEQIKDKDVHLIRCPIGFVDESVECYSGGLQKSLIWNQCPYFFVFDGEHWKEVKFNADKLQKPESEKVSGTDFYSVRSNAYSVQATALFDMLSGTMAVKHQAQNYDVEPFEKALIAVIDSALKTRAQSSGQGATVVSSKDEDCSVLATKTTLEAKPQEQPPATGDSFTSEGATAGLPGQVDPKVTQL